MTRRVVNTVLVVVTLAYFAAFVALLLLLTALGKAAGMGVR